MNLLLLDTGQSVNHILDQVRDTSINMLPNQFCYLTMSSGKKGLTEYDSEIFFV